MNRQNKIITRNDNVSSLAQIEAQSEIERVKRIGLVCPNCGGALEGRKCKLVCVRRGCGYLVTCSEW